MPSYSEAMNDLATALTELRKLHPSLNYLHRECVDIEDLVKRFLELRGLRSQEISPDTLKEFIHERS